MLKLLLTLLVLYVLVFWFLWPTLSTVQLLIARHYAWMRP